ncbi:MAG: hypothetical protein Q9198_006461 [Flavoplaca austrocitrina]
MPAGVKDKTRSMMGISTGEGTWAEVKVVPNEDGSGGLETEGKSHPGPRGWFASCVLGKDFDGSGVVLWGGINAKGETEGEGWMAISSPTQYSAPRKRHLNASMANLTSLVYHRLKDFQFRSQAPASAMPTKTTLPTTSRSGHPIYTLRDPKNQPPKQPINTQPTNSYPDFEISLNGTWKSRKHNLAIPLIDCIDLTGRFAYNATQGPTAAKMRPKNALRKGLRPTKSFELPRTLESEDGIAATRNIYRRGSPSTDGDDDLARSEPSPCESKTMLSKLPVDIQGKSSTTMPQSTGANVVALGQKRRVEVLPDEDDDDDQTLYEATPSPSKRPRLTSASDVAEGVAGNEEGGISSSRTVLPDQVSEPNPPSLDPPVNPAALPLTQNTANDRDHQTHNPSPSLFPTASITLPSAASSTILRIYLPLSSSPPSNPGPRTYIPLRLLSCPTIETLFQHVSAICDIPVPSLSVLRMHFDSESTDSMNEKEGKDEANEKGGKEAKGVMGIKRVVEESYICFVQTVERLSAAKIGKEGEKGDVGVEVEVVVNPSV